MEHNLNSQLYKSNIIGGDYLHNSIKLVLAEIAEFIGTSYGPYGAHSLIETPIGCESTKDGLTIVSSLKYDQSIAHSVHKTVCSVATKQVEEVGDGSTSTTLLLNLLYNGIKQIQSDLGVSPSTLKKSVKDTVDMLVENLIKVSTKFDDTEEKQKLLYDCVYTSLDGDGELADMIIELLTELSSPTPLVLIESSATTKHSYELVKGIELDGCTIRPDVFFNGLSRQVYDNPYILMVNGCVNMPINVLFQLNQMLMEMETEVIFMCTGVSDAIIDNCVSLSRTNPAMFTRMAFFQMKMTASNDEFMDICALLGARPLDDTTLSACNDLEILKRCISSNRGSCARAVLSDRDARFNDPIGDDEFLKSRIEEVDTKMTELKADRTAHNDTVSHLESRKAVLSRNFAKVYVGGNSSQRKAINYELVADAIPQAISARKHGIVPGCNIIIPRIIHAILKENSTTPTLDKLTVETLKLIHDSYLKLFEYIIFNKCANKDKATQIVGVHISEKGYVPLNIRDEEIPHDVVNSADTDRSILEYATDMAVLLATSKAFISGKTEFDIVNK
jgi:chaperonin GroEL (HSP60 family)